MIGDLVLVEVAIGELIGDMLTELYRLKGDDRPLPDTTGQRAKRLLGALKDGERYPGLPDVDGLRAWAIHVVEAAEDRNRIVHALALDRCVRCGDATRFGHNGKPVDRSDAAALQLTNHIRGLLTQGLAVGMGVSGWINAAYLAMAKEFPAEGNPPQVAVGGILHWCPKCSGNGKSRLVARVPAAIAILPAGSDMHELFMQLGGSDPPEN